MTSGVHAVTHEHVYRLSFAVKDVSHSSPIESTPSSQFEHLGSVWNCFVRRLGGTDKYLDVLVSPADANNKTKQSGLRFVRGNLVHKWMGTRRDNVILWSALVEKFCTDGIFTIEIFFTMDVKRRTYMDPSQALPLLTLKKAVFTDVTVVCKDSEEMIDCNKHVLAQASTVMLKAFSNPTSKESMEKKFTIGHNSATVENTHLLVKCMYEGWSEEMDNHANELMLLADCYECDRIAVMALDSIKRELTLETFWKTAYVAVLLQPHRPNLLDTCARFVDALPHGVYDFGLLYISYRIHIDLKIQIIHILNRDDRSDDRTVVEVAVAVAAFHKT